LSKTGVGRDDPSPFIFYILLPPSFSPNPYTNASNNKLEESRMEVNSLIW
jgi:hypothetical protein